MKGSITIKRELCKGCTLCMVFCPKQAIVLSNKLNHKGYRYAESNEDSGCTGCATCALVCPEIAIEVYRE